MDHIRQATGMEFPLTAEIEIPSEVKNSLNWIATTDPSIISDYWDIQLARLRKLVSQAEHSQKIWNRLIPQEIRGAQAKFKSVASHQPLSRFKIGATGGSANSFSFSYDRNPISGRRVS